MGRVLTLLLFCLAILVTTSHAHARSMPRREASTEESFRIQLNHHLRNLKHHDYSIMEESISRLAIFGKRAIPALVKVVNDSQEDKKYRLNAIYALGRLGKISKISIPLLLRLLPEGSSEYQGTIAGALGRIGIDSDKVLRALRILLRSNDEWVSKSAEMGLERIGTRRARLLLKEYKKEKKQK